MERLDRAFFERAPDDVANDIIGTYFHVRHAGRIRCAQLVESEAYGGSDDPASHAFRGTTPRCAVMFGPAGRLYVYRSYGLHWCMNVVTGNDGVASAVLLRAAQLYESSDDEAPCNSPVEVLRGPGNLTRGLGITGEDNGVDCCSLNARQLSFDRAPDDDTPISVQRSPRVGVALGKDRLSRYFLEGHPAVSRGPTPHHR